jgi:cell division protein ZapA (FtsZ GTPase activity inhibitor)
MSDLSIKVNIANRAYPLTVQRDEEEEVRKAAAYVNERLKALEQGFVVKDKLDLLAMLALELCLEKGHGREVVAANQAQQRVDDLIRTIDEELALA